MAENKITKKFEYRGNKFGLTLVVDNDVITRVIVEDGGLQFPFATKPFEQAAEFLSEEYGGELNEAKQVLMEVAELNSFKGVDTARPVSPETKKTSTKKKTTKKEKKENPTPKATKVEMTFELPKGPVTRVVQIKNIEEGMKPINTEDVQLDEVYKLHIDQYSAKNRTTTLINSETGEELIKNVPLMDAIYKYAEVAGMSFQQADKYIKMKRGLKVPTSKKKKKESKQESVIDKK